MRLSLRLPSEQLRLGGVGEALVRGERGGDRKEPQKDVGMLGMLPALKPETFLVKVQHTPPLPRIYHLNHTFAAAVCISTEALRNWDYQIPAVSREKPQWPWGQGTGCTLPAFSGGANELPLLTLFHR